MLYWFCRGTQKVNYQLRLLLGTLSLLNSILLPSFADSETSYLNATNTSILVYPNFTFSKEAHNDFIGGKAIAP